MTIEDRIITHEKLLRKWNDEKDLVETKLNHINEKIIYHWAAIQNLNLKLKLQPAGSHKDSI